MNWDDMVLVGRVGRTHGLGGGVIVYPETDFVAERFRVGATMWTPTAGGPQMLTVVAARVENGRPVVAFEGVEGIDAAARLTGQELRVPAADLQPLGPGQYYAHQLVGCAVETVGGEEVGIVGRVDISAGGSRLVVQGVRGEVLIPLVPSICCHVDTDAKHIRVDPPDGLLELNEPKRSRR